MYGRHIEVRLQSAMINAVYHKSLVVDLYACKESIGKINNLMSTDVEVHIIALIALV